MSNAAVLFDVDGTLLDTREFVLASFEFVSKGFAPPTRDVLIPHIGRKLQDIYADFAGADMADELTEVHRDFQVNNLHLSQPYAGTEEALEALHDAGYHLAAVTSRSRRTSVRTLELAGLFRFFGAVISAEDTPALKPDPAPLRAALERLGFHGGFVAMVGDTEHDIRAGRAIGATTVGVLYGFGGDTVRDAMPDYVAKSVDELPHILGSSGQGTAAVG
ncbi:MAG: HAD-IA family hydrolase [Dehalococcoidia bacterium]|nr:HAD-IA family hydrolase [Dehalococcoidia bacterium]